MKKVKTTLRKLNKKKSSGVDGLSQEQLIMGSNSLTSPLTKIINKSIKTSEFPSVWKDAKITPVPKKGDSQQKENYRPVSCLPAPSKLLEKLFHSVIDQIISR